MSKPYTEADLADQLDADRTWRIKEISDLKTAVGRADRRLQQVLLRSLVAISYAHFEGYIKFSAAKYMEHIALRKFPYADLSRQFLRNYFLPRLNALSQSRVSVKERCDLVDDILSSADKRFSRVNKDLIDTKSNLNFETLSEICLICGVPADEFQEKRDFIDVMLLKRRNSIAHGEETLVALEDMDEVATDVISLMRAFGTALENQAVRRAYAA